MKFFHAVLDYKHILSNEDKVVETRHLVASKAVVEKEVSEGVVEVGTKSNQAVRLVRV